MFEFVPLWNIEVFFAYALRRVDYPKCGVKVGKVQWAGGKSTITKTCMQFLATWAKRLSWKETGVDFRSTGEKVFRSLEGAVQ
jgi:transposase